MFDGRYARSGMLLIAAGAMIGLAACGGGNDQSTSGGASTDSTGGANAATSSGKPGSSSSAARGQVDNLINAGRTAERAVSKGTLIAIETERGGSIWEAQVVTSDGTEQELDVSGNGSKVVGGPSTKHEDKHDKTKHQDRVKAAKQNYEQAARKALAAVSHGKKVTELDLDTHRGKTVWEADVYDASNTKHEVKLDAAGGKVVADETD